MYLGSTRKGNPPQLNMPGFSGVRGALELIFAPELYSLALGTRANGQRSRSREWLSARRRLNLLETNFGHF